MVNLLRSLLKRVRITKGGADAGDIPVQQVEYMGKVSNAEILFPYGMHANLPEDCFLLSLSLFCNDQYKVAIGGLPQQRIKVPETGEVVFFHPLQKSRIQFKNNGNIEINTLENNGDITVDVRNRTENANNRTITATTEHFGDYTITGNVTIDGNLTVTGNIICNGNVTGAIVTGTTNVVGGGISLNSHVHPPSANPPA